ncbi:MAG: hypothetical protein Fur0023_21360 [Bacteroidia bacterium]
MNMINEEFYLSNEEKEDALNDGGQELTNDFLFNEKNFQTIIVQRKDDSASASDKGEQTTSANNTSRPNVKEELDVDKFIEQYTGTEKNDLLLWLKMNNYRYLLVEKIPSTSDKNILKHLLSAYWEAGFRDHQDLLLFVPYLLSDDFDIALEAYTAIIGLSKPFQTEDVQKALQMIDERRNRLPVGHIPLVDEIVNILNSELSNDK